MNLLELFCGIGGCGLAIQSAVTRIAGIDIDRRALSVYTTNVPRVQTVARTLESIPLRVLAQAEANLWWLSPPCQPFTAQGRQRDIDDHRSQAMSHLLRAIADIRPEYLAMENVAPFRGSILHQQWLDTLATLNYQVAEFTLCPSQWGWPNRRLRYYAIGSRDGQLAHLPAPPVFDVTLAELLDGRPRDEHKELTEWDERLARYHGALHLVDRDASAAMTHCFTSAYGKSPVRSGSYWMDQAQRLRHFSPAEVGRLLGFPADFRWPTTLTIRQKWSLLGNSLSLPVVRWVLQGIPELAEKLNGR